jgi:hypothetical protein
MELNLTQITGILISFNVMTFCGFQSAQAQESQNLVIGKPEQLLKIYPSTSQLQDESGYFEPSLELSNIPAYLKDLQAEEGKAEGPNAIGFENRFPFQPDLIRSGETFIRNGKQLAGDEATQAKSISSNLETNRELANDPFCQILFHSGDGSPKVSSSKITNNRFFLVLQSLSQTVATNENPIQIKMKFLKLENSRVSEINCFSRTPLTIELWNQIFGSKVPPAIFHFALKKQN